MTAATIAALLLVAAGFLQSLALMCRKLPDKRRPGIYPRDRLARTLFDLAWLPLFIVAILYALQLGIPLTVAAVVIYFLVLPFVFQLPLATLLGFKNFRAYLQAIDAEKNRNSQPKGQGGPKGPKGA